jgi:hypothetical protein
MPVILATQEAEIRRICLWVKASLAKIETLSQKYWTKERALVQVSKSSILPNLGHCDIDGWVFVLF